MTESHSHLNRVTGIAVALAATATCAHGQLLYSQGHADIGVAFKSGTLEPHWHLHSGGSVEDFADSFPWTRAEEASLEETPMHCTHEL